MALSIDWLTKIITVPKTYTTLVQSTPTEIRELPLNQFRLDLKAIEDDVEGMPQPKTHTHNTEVLLGGITYARVIEIINGYTVTFENGSYAVNLIGANSNVGDVVNLNSVSVRSANAAGLISNAAIEFSSFNGGVSIDVTSSYTGTVFPKGTPQEPVNNLEDAMLIATSRGFKKLFILESMIGANALNAGTDLSDFIIEGRSLTRTLVEVDTSADTTGITIQNCTVYGTLDGSTTIQDCNVGLINYFNGEIHDSGLFSTIYLGGGGDAALIDCYTIDQDNPPTIDMGDTGQDLAMPGYSGLVTITNLDSATDNVGIGLASGRVILGTTVVEGFVMVAGTGTVMDTLGEHIHTSTWNGAVTVVNETLDTHTIAEGVWDEDITGHTVTNSVGAVLSDVLQIEKGRWKIEDNVLTFYDTDGVSALYSFDLKDSNGDPTNDNPYERVPV